MTLTHRFEPSNSVGGIGEAIFYTLLSSLGDVEVVVSERAYQKQGVDFVLDGIKYDTKLDTLTATTGNVALETISVMKGGKVYRVGWAEDTGADCVVYIYLEGQEWVLLFFRPEEMQRIVSRGYRKAKVYNKGYESEVVLVPVAELVESKTFMRIPVVGVPDLSILRRVHDYLKHGRASTPTS